MLNGTSLVGTVYVVTFTAKVSGASTVVAIFAAKYDADTYADFWNLKLSVAGHTVTELVCG